MMPQTVLTDRNLLVWRKPRKHPQDMEDAILVAEGFGGRYSIEKQDDGFLLWLDDDEFVWKQFVTIDECKRYAECRFQKKVRDLYDKLKGKS